MVTRELGVAHKDKEGRIEDTPESDLPCAKARNHEIL